MRLSPILGLPIAEPDDFTTNYPVEVDEPRTTTLEQVVAVVPWGFASWGSAAAGVGLTRVSHAASYWYEQGLAFNSADSMFTINEDGIYQAVAFAHFGPGLTSEAVWTASGTSDVNHSEGSQASAVGGWCNSVRTVQWRALAGERVALWINASAACNLAGCELTVSRVSVVMP